jgi:hypothetical protein
VVKNGALTPGKGPLNNVSLVLRPDGSVYEEVAHKILAASDELAFIRGSSVTALSTLDTPSG